MTIQRILLYRIFFFKYFDIPNFHAQQINIHLNLISTYMFRKYCHFCKTENCAFGCSSRINYGLIYQAFA